MSNPNVKRHPKRKGDAIRSTSKEAAEQRYRIFVEAYLANGMHGGNAAITAGFSEKSAKQQAVRLLKHPRVLELLRARQNALAEKYQIGPDLVIRSIAQELNFDPAKIFNPDGSMKAITDLDEDTRAALTAVELLQIGSADAPVFVRKVKWASRAQAREQAMKHLGMFEADNAQKAGALAELPRDLLKALVERLRQMNRGNGGPRLA